MWAVFRIGRERVRLAGDIWTKERKDFNNVQDFIIIFVMYSKL